MTPEIKDEMKEDFYHFLEKCEWSDCASIIDAFGEAGDEQTARELHQNLNRAKFEFEQPYQTTADYQDMDDRNPR